MPLLPCVLLAIDLAADLPSLAAWWRDHQPALRRLTPADLAAATAAKDRRKAALSPRPPPPPDPPAEAARAPSTILPPSRLPPYQGPRLI